MTSRHTARLLTVASAVATFGALSAGRRWNEAQDVSNAVHNWWPARGETVDFGTVTARVTPGMQGNHSTILLHGLGTASDYWGGAWDRCAASGNALFVPDLLGFGRSSNPRLRPEQFGVAGHIDALEPLVARAPGRLTIAGHSMGGIVALGLAARHAERVDRVVLFAPPLHDSGAEMRRFMLTRGWTARYFASDRFMSQVAWRLVCTLPPVARRSGKVVAPWMPTPVAERVAGHSWNSFIGTLRGMMYAPGWREALETLQARGVDVTIAIGARDRGIDRDLLARLRGVTVIEHPNAGHQIPIMDPAWCAELVARPCTPATPVLAVG